MGRLARKAPRPAWLGADVGKVRSEASHRADRSRHCEGLPSRRLARRMEPLPGTTSHGKRHKRHMRNGPRAVSLNAAAPGNFCCGLDRSHRWCWPLPGSLGRHCSTTRLDGRGAVQSGPGSTAQSNGPKGGRLLSEPRRCGRRDRRHNHTAVNELHNDRAPETSPANPRLGGHGMMVARPGGPHSADLRKRGRATLARDNY